MAAAEDQAPPAPQRSRAPQIALGPYFTSKREEFSVQRNARPGTPIGRPKVEALSGDGNLVRWTMTHRYRRGGMRLFNVQVKTRPECDQIRSSGLYELGHTLMYNLDEQ